MSSQQKRARGANYTLEEKNLLMILINEYKHIIENKKTDAVTNAEKEKMWTKIANEFNAISPAGKYRDPQSLKKTYLNMKMAVRKEVADEKIEIFKTGGGSSKIICPPNPLRDITMQAMNQKTVYGLKSSFDSDATVSNEQTIPKPKTPEMPCAEHEVDDEDCETIFINCEETTDDWSKWKSADLKKPVSTPLRPKMLDTENTTPYSRRRPIAASVLHTNSISKLYNELAEKRLQVVEVEHEVLRNKEHRDQEKHDLEKNILEVQLQIKLEELKKLNPEWVYEFLNKNK